MSFVRSERHLYMVQKGSSCGLFLLWSCILLFPVAEGFLLAAFSGVLAAAGVIDLESRWVPGLLCLLLWCLGGIKLVLFIPNPIYHVLGAGLISALLLLIKFLFRAGIGGGDVKLLMAASLFLGGLPLLWGIFLGCLLALCAGVVIWLTEKSVSNCEMAFVPFLTIGILGTVLWGNF